MPLINESIELRESARNKREISGISPFFIVRHVPSSLAFYRDRPGFEITFQGPAPDDIFFGIVRREILLKDIGVAPVPNYTRDVKKGIARWDAFVNMASSEKTFAFGKFFCLLGKGIAELKINRAETCVVVEGAAQFQDQENQTSSVASCDVFQFSDGRLVEITSYVIALNKP